MTAHVILMALVPVFFVMALGYGAGRLRLVDNHQLAGMNALVMSFALPASILAATAAAPRAEMLAQGPLFAVLGVVMLVLYFSWYFTVSGSKADAALQALTIAFPNMAGVALPIASALLGPGGTVPVAIALAAGSLLVSPITLILVEMNTVRDAAAAERTRTRILRSLWRALTKPVVLAPAFGIALSLAQVDIGPVAKASLDLIGISAAGVALFLTGLVLSSQSFRLDWKVVGATAMGDIVRPLLTTGIVMALPIQAEMARVAILLAAVPAGFFGILFAVDYRLDSTAAGSMVIASSVLSIVTLATVIGVLF